MNKQKKIMLLGGIYYLKPAIEAAHKLGLHVITADIILPFVLLAIALTSMLII